MTWSCHKVFSAVSNPVAGPGREQPRGSYIRVETQKVFHPGRSHTPSPVCSFHGKIDLARGSGWEWDMLISPHKQATTTPKSGLRFRRVRYRLGWLKNAMASRSRQSGIGSIEMTVSPITNTEYAIAAVTVLKTRSWHC